MEKKKNSGGDQTPGDLSEVSDSFPNKLEAPLGPVYLRISTKLALGGPTAVLQSRLDLGWQVSCSSYQPCEDKIKIAVVW